MAPLHEPHLNRSSTGPAACTHGSRGVDKYSMDRIEQNIQRLKDRIARFRREHEHIWAKQSSPRTLQQTDSEHTEQRELTPAEQYKKDMGF